MLKISPHMPMAFFPQRTCLSPNVSACAPAALTRKNNAGSPTLSGFIFCGHSTTFRLQKQVFFEGKGIQLPIRRCQKLHRLGSRTSPIPSPNM